MADRGSVPYLVAVSLIAALGGLLFGYDTAVIAGAGDFLDAHFRLDPAAQGWARSSALLGCVIGVSFAGVLSDRFGRKRALIAAAILFLLSSIGTAVPPTFAVFVIFRIMAGLGVGVASMASPMYIAEITPARIRGRMVSVNQFAIVSGMLVIYFVNYFIARQGDAAWQTETGWRWMFASGAIPSGIFLLLCLLVPESPRWLVEAGRRGEALSLLARIGGRRSAALEIVEIERAISEERGSLRDLFSPGLRRVLAIGTALAVLQQVTGINVFLYYAPSIFKDIGGEGVDASLLQTIVVGAVNLGFTVVAIWTVDRIGRKPLMVVGSIGMGISLVGMGLASHLTGGQVASWLLLLILAYIGCFALSVGPVTWVILSEIFPNRIRGRALSIATFCLWSANFVVTQTFRMMDRDAGLVERFHHGFPFYIYGAFCAILLVVVVRFVPETKGKSLEEIERFWERGP
jgi:SP family xylose:H+ symportor-like MFS transporter